MECARKPPESGIQIVLPVLDIDALEHFSRNDHFRNIIARPWQHIFTFYLAGNTCQHDVEYFAGRLAS